MFYSVFVLGKKGPLARVWLAAHWDKKITKSQILEINIPDSVEAILQRDIRLSLRTSSHLMMGVCRILARKTSYLLQDFQDAAFRVRNAFRIAQVDLPDNKCQAVLNAITMPETFEFIETIQIEPLKPPRPPTYAQKTAITMEELIDMNEDEPLFIPSFIQEKNQSMVTLDEIEPNYFNLIDSSQHNFDSIDIESNHSSMIGSFHTQQASCVALEHASQLEARDRLLIDDGFGNPLGVGLDDHQPTIEQFFSRVSRNISLPEPMIVGQALEGGDIQPPAATPARNELSFHSESINGVETVHSIDGHLSIINQSLDDHHLMLDITGPFGPSYQNLDKSGNAEAVSERPDSVMTNHSILPPVPEEDEAADLAEQSIRRHESMSLLQLEALDSQMGALYQLNRNRRRPRNRKLIDKEKRLNDKQIKAQLKNTKDIVTRLDLAPPTRTLMQWKRDVAVEHMFGEAGMRMPSATLGNYYNRNCLTKPKALVEEEEEIRAAAPVEVERDQQSVGNIEPLDLDALGNLMDQPEEEEEVLPINNLLEPNDKSDHRTPLADLTKGNNRKVGSLPPMDDFRPQDVLNSTMTENQQGKKRSHLKENDEDMDAENIDPVVGASRIKRIKLNEPPVMEKQHKVVEPSFSGSILLGDQNAFEFSAIQRARDADDQRNSAGMAEMPSIALSHSFAPTEDDGRGGNFNIDGDDLFDFGPGGDPMSIPQVGRKESSEPMHFDSQGPPPAEEAIRLPRETDEQFEQRIRTQRTAELLKVLHKKFARRKEAKVAVDEILAGSNRKKAAQQFYTLLVLHASRILSLTQERDDEDSQLLTDGLEPEWMVNEKEHGPPVVHIHKGFVIN